MKKIFLMMNSLLTIALLVGCSTNGSQSKPLPPISAVSQPTDQIVELPIESVVKQPIRPIDMSEGEKISAYVATGNDIEKFVVEQKNNLFQTYDEISKSFSDGYPVVFSNTTDPAVRFAEMGNGGGDGYQTTQYFINQSKHSVLEVISGVSGSELVNSGVLYLILNGGSEVNIRVKEAVVDEKKSEVSYQGLLVNNELQYLQKEPLTLKLKSARQFKILGVSPDLTQVYFFDGTTNKFSYDMTSNKLQVIQVLPAVVAPIVKP
jgi:hypothetical protein